MITALRLVGLYERWVPKYWIEHLHSKYNYLDVPEIQKDRRISNLLETAKIQAQKPETVNILNTPFEKMVFVDEVRIILSVKRHGIGKKDEYVHKELRYGVTSTGRIIGSDSKDISQPAYDYIDGQFYINVDKANNHVFWHEKFLKKVLEYHESEGLNSVALHRLLSTGAKLARDDPVKIIAEHWIDYIMEQLGMYLLLKDFKNSKMEDFDITIDEAIREVVEIDLNRDFKNEDKVEVKKLVQLILKRFTEWASFDNRNYKEISDWKISDLIREFFIMVEKKANALRDEVLDRYGFKMCYGTTPAVSGIPYGKFSSCGNPDKKKKPEDWGWYKKSNGNMVHIGNDGKVRINDSYICIIGDQDESYKPMGDRIAARVFAVGTKLRNDIYTLNKYKGMLEEMFRRCEKYEKSESTCQHQR